jgi:uncharacterized protein YggE
MVRSARDAALVLLCWFMVGALPAFGKEPAANGARKVVATATATVQIKPDAARISFSVTSTEVTEKSVRDAIEKKIKKMKEALAAVKLNKADVKVRVLLTSVDNLLSAQPNAAGVRTVERKRARSIFYVTVREKDPEKLREAVGKLAEAAATHGGKAADTEDTPFARRRRGAFGGPNEPEVAPGPTIEWLASGSSTARRDAIRRAASDALADAQAAVGDAKLRVVETSVSAYQEKPLRNRVIYLSGGEETNPIQITVQVQITCSY